MPPTSAALTRVATAACALAVITGGSAQAAGQSTTSAKNTPAKPAAAASPAPTAVYPATLGAGVGRMVVGDSLSVSVAETLTAQGFAVDAKVGRQFGAARDVLAAYQNAVPETVVLALGTNGLVTVKACTAIVKTTGERRVFLVTNRVPRSWESANNRNLRTCAANFPGRVSVIDWFTESDTRPTYFRADGYHLSPAGQAAYARLIDGAVDRVTSLG